MTESKTTALRQRADFTHKHNLTTGRHGWLRLTPAYSVKIVEQLIEEVDRPLRVFDPFCGTATTALSAAYHGHHGVTTDINPFLIWLGEAKTAVYKSTSVDSAVAAAEKLMKALRAGEELPRAPRPAIHNIERWWSDGSLVFLTSVLEGIRRATRKGSQSQTLLLVAFCRSLIKLSNAAFNHQSMSFKEGAPEQSVEEMCATFEGDVRFVTEGARDNPTGTARVVLGDSRNSASVVDGPFDLVITSPPYANRMSYIRELRPYMYWLGFLSNGKDAGELDWSAIGGTWGVATSRLTTWRSAPSGFKDHSLAEALDRVAHEDNKNGPLLANYVAKYFDDMWGHFRNLIPVLAEGAHVHYIVGNSTFYGVLLPVEKLYAAMLDTLGFEEIACHPIRKRNSKKELVEFDVRATWPGRGRASVGQ